MQSGTIRLDIHGMTCTQAQAAIDAALRRAGGSVYHGGTQLREMVRRVYARHPRVKRLEVGLNQGATELVLREYV